MNNTTKRKPANLWKYLLLIVLSLVLHGKSIAQVYTTNVFTITINDVILIRINPLSTISMNLLASVAGETTSPKSNSTSYLQLTSIAPAGQTRRIMASITSGFVPAGTLLKLTASSCSTGAGTRGSPSGQITLLKNINTTLINNIGSGYSGTAATNGFNLTYYWNVDPANYALLRAIASAPITVTYTISNN
jgi:hypothetical protein